MIQSFADDETESIFGTGTSRKWLNGSRIAARRLQAVDFASAIEDLQKPPGNRLEKLKSDRNDNWSIRIDDQYRVSFRWDGKDAWGVQIVDDH